jgi:hypothetical protein
MAKASKSQRGLNLTKERNPEDPVAYDVFIAVAATVSLGVISLTFASGEV